ncbi:MAG: NUDIX domain-containing protein [Methylococcaceae bacterium]|nr:NUDIX domain-containing protein [Methylococcaceae bacterium]
MVWKPHVTVAAVVEKQQRFLLVEEQVDIGLAFNQPAGHLEEGEDLTAAVKREVLEETAWQFDPEHVISIQLWRKNPDAPSFLRVCFAGQVYNHNPEQALDEGIIKTHWLTRDEVAAKSHALRSPLVLESIDDYLQGQFYPLSLLKSSLDLNYE